MCNHYRNDIRKAGLEFEEYGYDEFSETRIKIRLDNAVAGVRENVFPDSAAMVAKINDAGVLAPEIMRWGHPPVKEKMPLVTNVRNTWKEKADGTKFLNPYWKPWLKPELRCLVPATSFAEFDDRTPKGQKVEQWFSRSDDKMLCFAGIWRTWQGDRGTKKEPVAGPHMIFAFLTTESNDLVRPVHAKAMPVILERDEWDTWLTAPIEEALKLQRPAANHVLRLAK